MNRSPHPTVHRPPTTPRRSPAQHETIDAEVVESLGVEVLVRIPFDAGLAAAADRGRPFLEGEGLESVAGRALTQLVARVDAYQPPGPEGESW